MGRVQGMQLWINLTLKLLPRISGENWFTQQVLRQDVEYRYQQGKKCTNHVPHIWYNKKEHGCNKENKHGGAALSNKFAWIKKKRETIKEEAIWQSSALLPRKKSYKYDEYTYIVCLYHQYRIPSCTIPMHNHLTAICTSNVKTSTVRVLIGWPNQWCF